MQSERVEHATCRLGVCYHRLAKARAEIAKALDLNISLPTNEQVRVPDWQVSDQSSVFHSRSGEASFELYNVNLLPCDQLALLEIMGARNFQEVYPPIFFKLQGLLSDQVMFYRA
ncbi:UNVERIFIED_CONTAM: hypothetical protein Sangu_1174200 [Sesamum angustifolium]|uniref:Uncharacterized protein n=1 Tax=Sesamum angustifolium TaxID=2727405 RepID=A0AAW2NHU8_9LAMI